MKERLAKKLIGQNYLKRFMEKLNKRKIKKELDKKGLSFSFFKKIDSTFSVYSDSFSPDIVLARTQTLGRGRLNRQFFCKKGGIYLCIRVEKSPLVTINTAVGVIRALKKAGINANVKWVNDILVDKKKVCGILVKEINGFAIIGIGLNYCIKKFPAHLNNAKSIFCNTLGINDFTLLLIDEVAKSVKNNNLDYYIEHLLGVGEKIMLDNKEVILVGVDKDGSLIYRENGEIKSKNYGDICL